MEKKLTPEEMLLNTIFNDELDDEDYVAMENKLYAEKHRADVVEEALRLACNDVRHNYYMTGTEALIDNYKQQAEARLKELEEQHDNN